MSSVLLVMFYESILHIHEGTYLGTSSGFSQCERTQIVISKSSNKICLTKQEARTCPTFLLRYNEREPESTAELSQIDVL